MKQKLETILVYMIGLYLVRTINEIVHWKFIIKNGGHWTLIKGLTRYFVKINISIDISLL